MKNARALYCAGVVVVNSKVVGLAPGVDIMITIFCDFCQYLAKKLAISQKTMLWLNFCKN
jgi:hypothetical protein